jgi:TatD DNase family protein
VLPDIPLDRLVLETDAPYLTPVPYRGKRNESSYLIFVAQKISEIYHITLEETGKITSSNAQQLFGLQ